MSSGPKYRNPRRIDPKVGLLEQDLLAFALENYAGFVGLADMRRDLVEAEEGHGADGLGTVTVRMPDQCVKSLKGAKEDAVDRLLIMRIPSWIEENAVNPLSVQPGSRIIKPT